MGIFRIGDHGRSAKRTDTSVTKSDKRKIQKRFIWNGCDWLRMILWKTMNWLWLMTANDYRQRSESWLFDWLMIMINCGWSFWIILRKKCWKPCTHPNSHTASHTPCLKVSLTRSHNLNSLPYSSFKIIIAYSCVNNAFLPSQFSDLKHRSAASAIPSNRHHHIVMAVWTRLNVVFSSQNRDLKRIKLW